MPTRNVPIDVDLLSKCQEQKLPWLSTTAFVNQMVYDGLKGVAEHVTLKVPSGTDTDTKVKKKEEKSEGTLSNTNRVPNTINKEKEIFKKTRFKFHRDLIPFELSSFSDLIESFWKVKTGRKTEESFNLLISGLSQIKKKYGSEVVKTQLELAIVGGPKGPLSGITLKNYETFGTKTKGSFQAEQPINHPASRVFRADDSGNPLVEGII